MLAITVPFLEKFACVVGGKIIGLSRHSDYFEYHFRLRDLKKIRIEGLTKFVRVNGQGQVESIVLTETLLTKGTKIESQPVESLSDEEKAVIAAAIELVNQPVPSETESEAESAADAQEEDAPAGTAATTPVAQKPSKKKSRSRQNRQSSTTAAH